jgi:hypothetical protein
VCSEDARTDVERKPHSLSRNFSFALIVCAIKLMITLNRPAANGAELGSSLFQGLTVKYNV